MAEEVKEEKEEEEEEEEGRPRDFSEIAADMPDEEELVWDAGMREADAKALSALMANEPFLERCERKCGVENMAAIRKSHEVVSARDVGQAVESVVEHYGAPHLRPTSIAERASDEASADGACWSMLNLLRYAVTLQEKDAAPAAVGEEASSSAAASDER
mmetsp:Transcript_116247/g.248668  ORF Transcript_116247/g.248668 Transcript_116247/m.248668 type:complete len:160 (+) Transcript_116247:95-574(+)